MDEKVTVTKFQGVTRCATEPVGGLKKFPRITSIETIETIEIESGGHQTGCTALSRAHISSTKGHALFDDRGQAEKFGKIEQEECKLGYK